MKPVCNVLLAWGSLFMCCKEPVWLRLERKDIIETVYASGKIVSDNEYNVVVLNNGTIVKKSVRDGDRVERGQVLFIVQNEAVQAKYEAAADVFRNTTLNLSDRSPLLKDLQLSLRNADIRRKNDSLTYHRWKSLWDQGIGTRSNLDNAYANYQVSVNAYQSALEKYNSGLHDLQVSNSNARSQLEAVKKELGDYYIRADRGGVVWQTFKEAGEGMRANETVAVIGDSSRRIIRLAVDQEDIGRVSAGQKVYLKTDMSGDFVYEGRVSQIYPAMNEMDQTFRVDAIFVGKMPPAYIHGTVEANIVVASKKSARVLAREALTGGDSVWIIDSGKKKKIAVTTGLGTMDYIEIIGGLDERSTVIVESKTDGK